MPRPPSAATWRSESCNPSSTTATRSSRWEANRVPGRRTARCSPRLASTAPRTTATVEGFSDGTAAATANETTLAPATTASPGATGRRADVAPSARRRNVRVTGSCVPTSMSTSSTSFVRWSTSILRVAPPRG